MPEYKDFLTKQIDSMLAVSGLSGGRDGFWLSSRIHPLPALGARCWLKREDELNGSIPGSKWRKIVGLEIAWREAGIDTLLAYGGSRSMQLLGLMQVAPELGLDLKILSKEGSPQQLQGFDLLWALLVQGVELRRLPRSQWGEALTKAQLWQEDLRAAGRRVFLVHEGAAQLEALLGLLSLPLDIVRQEQRLGHRWQRILIDAGTGMTAQALILGLGLLGRQDLCCEVLLCAGREDTFVRDLKYWQQELAQKWGLELWQLPSYRCHYPLSAKSFGATNQAVFQEIVTVAEAAGVLLEPIYTAKLFHWLRQASPSAVETLIIHSGGTQSLFGFAEALSNSLAAKHI